MSDPKLSVIVVARNEEAQLAACLDKLVFADEIILVLDRCTDRSKEIALLYTDKIIEGSWSIEGPRRHAGIQACSGDWILEIDADERVSKDLESEIREVIKFSSPGYFLIPINNYIGKKLVRHGWGGSWGVMSAPRLFTPGAKIWGNQRIHPALQLSGPKRRLVSPISHFVDDDLADMIRRLQRYTDAKAADMLDSDATNPTFLNILRRSVSRFIKCWIMRKGWREGYWGFTIALMAALYPLLSYLKFRLNNHTDSFKG